MKKHHNIKNLKNVPLFFRYFFKVKLEKNLEGIPNANNAINNKLDDYSKHISTICKKLIS